MGDSDHCPFLGLPTELRLLIYGFALLDSPAITIGSAELVGPHPDIVHRLYGDKRQPHQGLPQNHEPVIETHYNASLLSITKPPIIPITPLTSCPPENQTQGVPHEAHAALLSTNKQIREELMSHFKHEQNRRTGLFISYPHGLHVLATSAPQLIKQARSVHIAGVYAPRNFSPQRAAQLRHSMPASICQARSEKEYHGGVIPPHGSQLGTLLANLFGPSARHPVQKLELRIYYPGPDSYSTVWGDDDSPTVIALRNIYAGEVTIEVWRGRLGTGVYLYIVPNQGASERGKRVVSTVWRRLEEGGRGEPECGSWVVDPAWPEWRTEGDVREDEGCVVFSVPAGSSDS